MSRKYSQEMNSRAFAFSADIVLALVLVIGVLLFLTTPTQPAQHLEERRVTDQYVDDIFVALDHSGYVTSQIDANGFSATTLTNVYSRAKTFLPGSYDLFMQLKSYPVDVAACRTFKTFAKCFPDANTTLLTTGTPLPTNAPYVHGRRIFLKQQPASQCTSSLSPSDSSIWDLFTRGPAVQFANSLNIAVDVNVSPSGPLTCDENITATLSVTGTTGARKPVDMMLVIDRSGSMSWESEYDLTGPQGIAMSGNFAYVADGSSGLRDFNVASNVPVLVGTYNSPGTARDVSVNGNYAYLADGTSGLRVVSISNPAAPSSAAVRVLGNDAYASATNGSKTFIATSGGTTTDQSNTGSQNQVLTIGQNAAGTSAGQSFIPTIDFITGVSLYLKKTGSPASALTVDIRSSINGAALASTTIPAASISAASYNLVTATFPNALALTSGNTYYIVATTGANNAANYYQWGARSGNNYANGQAYQNQTAQNGWDARFESYYISGLIDVNTATPTSPSVIGAATLTDPWRIFLSGTTAYVADGSAGIKLFDVSGNTPVQLGSLGTTNARDIYVSGSYAYVADDSAGLRIINVSNPAAPSLTGTYNTPGTAYAVRVVGTTAYVSDSSSVQVINVSNPAVPAFIRSFATPYNSYRDFEAQNGYGYFLQNGSSLQALTIVSLNNGTKIDQIKVAATTFVDFNGWDSSNDQLGMVSYSSSATLDQTLTHTYSLVKSDINALVASGGTATGDGVNTATNQFLTGQADVSNSGSQNQTLTIGQNAAGTSAGQSFQPVMPYLSRVDVYVRHQGNPAVPLTVEIRSAINGTVLGSTTISAGSITGSYALRTATFGSVITLTPGQTYYIVLSTSANNAANYYQWGAQSPSTYANGQAYQNQTAQGTWDGRFVTYGQYTNPTALKFQILMSDGLTNTGSSSATAAITAKNNGIVIYTIGFGADADGTELSNIANITGGKYYAALDANALIDVYSLIAQQIQLIATDANISVSIPSGTLIISDGNGILSGQNLIFDINTQKPQPWVSTYTFNIPCSSQLACSSTLISIPSPGTQFQYVDANGNPQAFDWNVFETSTFNYRDLNIELTSGTILGTNNVDLTYTVQSNGNLDTNGTTVGFYLGDPSLGNVLATASIPPLCGKLVPGCVDYTYSSVQNVQAEGDLYAKVNPSNSIAECTFNDQDVLFCYNTPATQFYTLDYWAWLHG